MKPADQKRIKDAVIEQATKLIEKNFGEVIKVKGDDNQINFGLAVQIETSEAGKHNVQVKLSFSEKHTFMLERELEDPNQTKLPLEGGEAGDSTTRQKSKKT